MDEKITIKPNEWIITEGSTPAYYLYEMVSGRVGIYRNGTRVNEITVKDGEDSVLLGIIAAVRDDRVRAASVKTETEVKAILHSMDQIWGIFKNEIPADLKSGINTMIEAITTKNDIDRMSERLTSLSKVSVKVPENLRSEAKTIINEISRLYADLLK